MQKINQIIYRTKTTTANSPTAKDGRRQETESFRFS